MNTKVKTFARTSKAPMPFGNVHPGSLFTIHAERSRGLHFSRDLTVYRKAKDSEGFYAYDSENPERAACLYHEDLVWPVVAKRS